MQLLSSGPTERYPYPHLTGELDPKSVIVTAEKKKELLESFAAEYGVSLARAICIGDGANDLRMLGATGSSGGLAIAFMAKPSVQQQAPNRLNGGTLTDILYLLGKTEPEVDELVRVNKVSVINVAVQTALMPRLDVM